MKLAEIYIRADRPTGPDFDGLALKLEEQIVDLARQIYVREVTVEFTLQEGSIIERAKVVGKRLVVAGGVIASYHGLRESVIDIYHDAQKFGEIATEQFSKITHTPKSAIQSKRMIPPDVERLHRIIQSADSLQEANLNPADRARRYRAILSDIEGLTVSSRQEIGSQDLIKYLPWEKIPGLPDTVAEAVQLIERKKKVDKDKRLAELPPRFDRELRKAPRKYSHKTQI